MGVVKIFAETERLVLRELLPTDVDGMFELDSDPLVHQYLGNQPINDKKQSEEIIHFVRQQYMDNGIGRWAVVDKKTNEFMGWSGLKLVKETINNQSDFYDVGYRLIRKYWGKGFATESAVASLAYGFDHLKINEIFAAAHSENMASNSILKKVGFRLSGTFDYFGALQHWYRITLDEWNNGNPNTYR